jgi:hypothetical protein
MLPNWGIDKEEEEKQKKMSWLHGYFSKSDPLMKLILPPFQGLRPIFF